MENTDQNKKSVFNESKRNLTVKRLILEGDAETFDEFMDNNREKIYRGIIEIFKNLKDSKRKKFILHLDTQIGTFAWNTDFEFTIEEAVVLYRDVLPYYQDIEDYETCQEVLDLYRHFVPE